MEEPKIEIETDSPFHHRGEGNKVKFQSGGLILETFFCPDRGDGDKKPGVLSTKTKWKEIDSDRSDNLDSQEFFEVFSKLLEHFGGPSKVMLSRDSLYCDHRYDEAISKFESLGYKGNAPVEPMLV